MKTVRQTWRAASWSVSRRAGGMARSTASMSFHCVSLMSTPKEPHGEHCKGDHIDSWLESQWVGCPGVQEPGHYVRDQDNGQTTPWPRVGITWPQKVTEMPRMMARDPNPWWHPCPRRDCQNRLQRHPPLRRPHRLLLWTTNLLLSSRLHQVGK